MDSSCVNVSHNRFPQAQRAMDTGEVSNRIEGVTDQMWNDAPVGRRSDNNGNDNC